jgi:hypothetical protein
MKGNGRGLGLFVMALCLSLINFPGLVEESSAAPAVARMTPAGDGLELEYVGEDGITSKDTIPVHRSGDVRYFSAGVGVDERTAAYPRFPLKLIFVAGAKAYTSQVSVTIADAKGAVRLQVPAGQVSGPWLFVDLPAGTYTITATRGDQTQAKATGDIAQGRTKTVYMRWKE